MPVKYNLHHFSSETLSFISTATAKFRATGIRDGWVRQWVTTPKLSNIQARLQDEITNSILGLLWFLQSLHTNFNSTLLLQSIYHVPSFFFL
jgi:hypothetical protein